VRRAVVTGGSSGIGRSIVQKLTETGIQTLFCDIEEPASETSGAESSGDFFKVDLTDPRQIETFCEQILEEGPPDVLVCNAGRGVHEKLTEGDPEIWEQIFQLNVFSTLRLIRGLVPAMTEQDQADVVFISSVSSTHTYPYGGIYAATKAAVDTLAETLRLESQPDVRTTVIRPGVVDTSFFESMIHGDQTPESIGWGAVRPDQIADAVHYAVTRDPGIALNEIVIRPAAQPM